MGPAGAGDRAGGCHPMKAGEDSGELAQEGELVIFPVGRGPGVLCKRRTQDRRMLRALRVLSRLRLNRGFGWVGPLRPLLEGRPWGPLLCWGLFLAPPTVGPGLLPPLCLLRSRGSPGRRSRPQVSGACVLARLRSQGLVSLCCCLEFGPSGLIGCGVVKAGGSGRRAGRVQGAVTESPAGPFPSSPGI